MEKPTMLNETDYGNRSMEGFRPVAIIWCVPPHLDDRIHQLCAQVVAATEEDVVPAISELKAALREHHNRLRKLAAGTLSFLLSSPGEPSLKDPAPST